MAYLKRAFDWLVDGVCLLAVVLFLVLAGWEPGE